MKLLILSGFLGCGKTTLLLAAARALTGAGRKVAILENEVGKVGVDDRVLAAEGLRVRELYSGCVCCTLRLDLIATLMAMEKELAPDVVILEPSGVAAPGAVRDAFRSYDGSLDGVLLAVLADVPRFVRIARTCAPFFDAALNEADLLVLTKADAAAPGAAAAAKDEVRGRRPDVPVHAVSVQTGEGLPELLTDLLRRLGVAEKVPAVPAGARLVGPAPRPNTAVCAVERRLEFPEGVAAADVGATVAATVQAVADAVRSRGIDLLGHVKAVLEVPGNGYFAYSLTGAEAEPQRRGSLGGRITRADLRLNAILCEIPEADLRELVETCLAAAGLKET